VEEGSEESERARARLSVKDKHAIWHRPDRFGGQQGAAGPSGAAVGNFFFLSPLLFLRNLLPPPRARTHTNRLSIKTHSRILFFWFLVFLLILLLAQ